MKINFVPGCITVSGISFFSLQSLIKTYAEYDYIAVFRCNYCLRNSVLIPCQIFNFVFI